MNVGQYPVNLNRVKETLKEKKLKEKMTLNMKKENFRRMKNWNVAFALLFYSLPLHRKRTQEKDRMP